MKECFILIGNGARFGEIGPCGDQFLGMYSTCEDALEHANIRLGIFMKEGCEDAKINIIKLQEKDINMLKQFITTMEGK